jgi:large conductance mechanosensitive channel protein
MTDTIEPDPLGSNQTAQTNHNVHVSNHDHYIRGKSTVAVIVKSEYNPVNGFITFIREHAIVGLAIGFVIGTQVQGLVKQLVTSFISPLFNLFFGHSLTSRDFSLTFHQRHVDFPWGTFIYALLNFLFVVIAIYAIVKVLKLDKLDKPQEKEKLSDKIENIEEHIEEGVDHAVR